MYSTTYNINFVPGNVPTTIHISQYDKSLREYTFIPYAVPGELDLSAVSSVTLEATKPDGFAVINNCTWTNNTIKYTLSQQLGAVVGKVWSKLVIRDGASNILGTAAIVWVVDPAGVKQGAVVSESDISAIEEWVEEIGDVADLKEDFENYVGGKKMWSIQTNTSNGDTWYQLGVSADGYGHTLVPGYDNFLGNNVPSGGIATDWVHFQHGDYHVFTITYDDDADFYVAVTKDFKTWVHRRGDVGFRTASGFTNPYVWTPQIFEFDNKLYIAATVQEGAANNSGSRYQSQIRYAGIYAIEIILDYDTATVSKANNSDTPTRITFGDVTDKTGSTHSISGCVMDAFFVPDGNTLRCVFNDRYMLEIHTAHASSISGTFAIDAQNIFKTPNVEAPTVLKISDHVWQISCGYYGDALIPGETNIKCYTTDFVNFYNYGFMARVNIYSNGAEYVRRMRNPCFFFMTDEQEHYVCSNYDVQTNGYVHISKPAKITMDYHIVDMLNYTETAATSGIVLCPNASSTITFSKLNIPDVYGCDNEIIILNTNDSKRTVTYDGTAYHLVKGDTLKIGYKGDSVSFGGIQKYVYNTDVIAVANNSYTATNTKAMRANGVVTITFEVGGIQASSSGTTIGTITEKFRPNETAWGIAYVGTSSMFGTPCRIGIGSAGNVIVYAQSDMSGTSTMRASLTYPTY